jgi:hypothetical protein
MWVLSTELRYVGSLATEDYVDCKVGLTVIEIAASRFGLIEK